tara:strand:+ start:3264 stop:3635 length:372 start_codon:yes stop_codon:yes gene_type:complete
MLAMIPSHGHGPWLAACALCVVGIALMMAVVSCASDDADMFGNVYPVECRGDLSGVVASITRVPQFSLPHGALGATVMVNGKSSIFIEERLNDREYASVLKHERCHALLYSMGKDPQWHKVSQ